VRRLVWDAGFRRAFKRVTRRAPELQDRIFEDAIILVDIGSHDEVY